MPMAGTSDLAAMASPPDRVSLPTSQALCKKRNYNCVHRTVLRAWGVCCGSGLVYCPVRRSVKNDPPHQAVEKSGEPVGACDQGSHMRRFAGGYGASQQACKWLDAGGASQ